MDHKISSFSQLHIAEPSPQMTNASPLKLLPPEMVSEVAGNLSAQALSSFGKTAHFSRSVAAPLLGKIISLRNQITALNVATEEGREKAGRLCEAISQLPQAHQAIPVKAMAGLIERVAMQAQADAQTGPSSFENALRLTCKLPKPGQPAALNALINRISGMDKADQSTAFDAVLTAISVLAPSDQPALLNKMINRISGMDKADKPTAFDAVLKAINVLSPSDQPAVLNALIIRIGGMNQADQPTAFDAALTAINVLAPSDQSAVLNQLMDQIGGMNQADRPTAFDDVLRAINVQERSDQPTALNALIIGIDGMDKAGKLQTFPSMFNVIDQLPAHQKAQKDGLHHRLDQAVWDLTAAEKEEARGVDCKIAGSLA